MEGARQEMKEERRKERMVTHKKESLARIVFSG